jgi:hypothetical protein
MKKSFVVALAVAGSVFAAQSADFAQGVADYLPGIAPAPGFTNANAALGQPTIVNPFGDEVTPFNPPYSAEDIVSIGESGSLTLRFHTPILNHPNNAFGIDFIIYGNAGFIVTNELNWDTFEWIGIPATDGSLFGANDGETLVSVSQDGVRFYTLDPALAPTVDRILPTDSRGDFHTPAIPGLMQADFAGLTENEIAALYLRSAGGAGYDLSWARDSEGRPVHLQHVRFIRIAVLSGRSEVDAVASVFTPRGLARK